MTNEKMIDKTIAEIRTAFFKSMEVLQRLDEAEMARLRGEADDAINAITKAISSLDTDKVDEQIFAAYRKAYECRIDSRPMKLNTCGTCMYHVANGLCTNDKLCFPENIKKETDDDTLICIISEKVRFYTGNNFGCVHHQPDIDD